MSKKAFTLAEVLFSLGIIGVVAALTLPSIMRINEEAAIGPRLAKVQSAMEEATSRVMLDDPSKPIGDIDKFEERLMKHLAMQKADKDGYRLKDGMYISFAAPSSTNSIAAGEGYKDIIVDVNGMDSKPNVDGVDKFRFTLSTNGLMVAQGCAGVIQSNNWKVPKGYDYAACTAYNTGTQVDTSGNEITKDDELTSKTKECSDGSVVPINATCKKLCADGKYVAEDADCSDMYTCWDGSQAISKEYCPPEPATITCWDGSTVYNEADCPAETKTCENGDIIGINEKCKEQCWNGSWVDDLSSCPAETKTCDNGDVVNVNENCPVLCDDGKTWVQDMSACPTKASNQPNPANLRKTLKKGIYCRCSNDQGGYTNLTHYYYDKSQQLWVELEGVYSVTSNYPGTYDVYDGEDADEVKDYFSVGW